MRHQRYTAYIKGEERATAKVKAAELSTRSNVIRNSKAHVSVKMAHAGAVVVNMARNERTVMHLANNAMCVINGTTMLGNADKTPKAIRSHKEAKVVQAIAHPMVVILATEDRIEVRK